MQLELEGEHIQISDAMESHVRKCLSTVEKRWGDRLTRVEMHLKDINSKNKGGVDKHCTFEARPAGLNPLTAEDTAEDAYDAIKGAADKLERVLEQAIERRERRR